ncbi:hypothetical protein [Calycomorphotria hydatis]|uniref:Uncharacterized protein n=1 Tax=Calycomorphotria hydatis TaxID=2528027 RepID=A0A517TA82_9PLAN|nr:hypothetical protein [Calycomorphotria hydatis]QDT65281.1 hypothetical protein V22_25290 [Calycomorphotria hydatis]
MRSGIMLLFAGFVFITSNVIIGCTPKLEKPEKPNLDAVEAPPAAPKPNSDGVSVTKKKTREILDLQELAGKPEWEQVEMDVRGNDPLSVSQSAYFHAASQLGAIPIEQWINQQKAVEGKTPNYAELQDFMKQNASLTLPALKPWQHYAYNAEEGKIVVVENRDEREAALK